MTAFFITVFTIYFLFLILLMIGWGISSKQSIADHRFYFLSVIIPFRNEEKNLPILINTLRKLDYPKDQFEILLINDHSTDNSELNAKQLTGDFPNFKIISATSNGKKLAIAQGVEVSSGEIIVTTDADCELPVEWLKSTNKQFQDQSIKMIVGAVRIKSNNTFFSKLQATEFSSLIGSAGATLNLGFPTMCNGANLSYRKEVFREIKGFDGNVHIASGDDEFLMRKVTEKFGAKSLKFLKNPTAIVTTCPQVALKDFLLQRIRWAGKWRHNSSRITKIIAVFVLLFQVSWLLAIGSVFIQPIHTTIFGLLSFKILLEVFFLFKVSKFMRQRFYWGAFLLLQILYPLYVIVVGVFSNVISVSWKERPIPR